MFWFQAILNGFLIDFPPAVRQTSSNIVEAAVEIYNRMSVDLLPTPAKSHYVFNLRDLSKCVQGDVLNPNSRLCVSIALHQISQSQPTSWDSAGHPGTQVNLNCHVTGSTWDRTFLGWHSSLYDIQTM